MQLTHVFVSRYLGNWQTGELVNWCIEEMIAVFIDMTEMIGELDTALRSQMFQELLCRANERYDFH